YERTDDFNPSVGDYKSPLLLYGSSKIEYSVKFDSLNNVIITESLDKEQIKVPLVITLDKYIQIRSRLAQQNQLYQIMSEVYQIETEDDLSKLFKKFTEITIPLPFETETIFGPPTINLKINGIIDITASYQHSTNDLQTIISPTQNQNNINFKQEVQVTTKGTVGDKLSIDADWNSQRTFDFENQLRLKYKGYPDEVIQTLEAGNVSLETKSNLIGSTLQLFGVKAQFKLGPLMLTTIASQKKSEKKEVNVTGGTVENPFNIPIYDYAENNYLLDETYGPKFEEYLRTGQTSIEITKIEVWVYSEASNPRKRSALGVTLLAPRPDTGYGPAIAHDTSGRYRNGVLYKLDEADYTVNKFAGYITLNNYTPTQEKDQIAVAYTVKENNLTTQYGDYIENVPSDAKLTLKMLRERGLRPPDQGDTTHKILWNRLMKNIYHLGARNLNNDPSSLPEFNTYY